MKNKFFLLSSIISSCILMTACNQSTADELHPDMPTSIPQPNRCYPASKCVGDPNLIGGNGGTSQPTGKVLQTESTEKLVGVVKSVDRIALPNQTQIQLTLATDHGDVLVIVGPARFFDQSKIKVQSGDKVTITGYRIKANGQNIYMAAEIKKNGNTLKLLDDNRQPVWGNQGSGSQNSGYQGSRYQGSGYRN